MARPKYTHASRALLFSLAITSSLSFAGSRLDLSDLPSPYIDPHSNSNGSEILKQVTVGPSLEKNIDVSGYKTIYPYAQCRTGSGDGVTLVLQGYEFKLCKSNGGIHSSGGDDDDYDSATFSFFVGGVNSVDVTTSQRSTATLSFVK